jgi:hypothetical protein
MRYGLILTAILFSSLVFAQSSKVIHLKCSRNDWAIFQKTGLTAEINGLITLTSSTTNSATSRIKTHTTGVIGRSGIKLFPAVGNSLIFNVSDARVEGSLEVIEGAGNSPELHLKFFNSANQRLPISATVSLNQFSRSEGRRNTDNVGWVLDAKGNTYLTNCADTFIQ